LEREGKNEKLKVFSFSLQTEKANVSNSSTDGTQLEGNFFLELGKERHTHTHRNTNETFLRMFMLFFSTQ